MQRILNTDPVTRYTIDQIKYHDWYKKSGMSHDKEGIIVGYHEIPVDETILNKL